MRTLPGQLVVVGGDEAAFAVGAQVLGKVEAEGGRIAKATGPASLVLGAVRLAGVFDDLQAVAAARSPRIGSMSAVWP